jgi:AAA domain-containing protein
MARTSAQIAPVLAPEIRVVMESFHKKLVAADNETARMQAIRDGAAALESFGYQASPARDRLSETAIAMGSKPDDVQTALAAGIQLARTMVMPSKPLKGKKSSEAPECTYRTDHGVLMTQVTPLIAATPRAKIKYSLDTRDDAIGKDRMRALVPNLLERGLIACESKAAMVYGLGGSDAEFAFEEDRIAALKWLNSKLGTKLLHFPEPAHKGLKLWWHGDRSISLDRTWLVEGMLPEIGTSLVSGQWGLYKTFVVVDLAIALMAGQSFAGRAVNRRCGVLFIAAEGAYEIPLRLQCAYEAKYPEATAQLPFAMADECPRVLDRSALPVLQDTAAAATEHMRTHHSVDLGLIIVDTMAAAAGFNDENDNAEAQRAMNVFTALSRQFKCLVIPVDHFGKLAETGTRGGSAKEASVDAVLALLGEKDLSGNVTNPRMAVRKVRGAPTGSEIPFSVRVVNAGVGQDGNAETTLVIDWHTEGAPAKAPKEKWPTSVRIFRDALIDALSGARPLSLAADGPTVRAVEKEAVRQAFYSRYPAEGETESQRQAARQKQFIRGVEQAQARGLIGIKVVDKAQFIWLCEP